jgi:hypothetical protein
LLNAGCGHYYYSVSKIRKYAFAILGTLLLLILVVWSPWSALLYNGDGRFSDQLFFYPRYWIRLTDISLNEAGEYHFHLAGLPNQELSLVLYVRGSKGNWDNRMSLTQFPVTIEAKLTDGKGNVACHAIGSPTDANKDGAWVLMSAPGEAGYWHYGCNFVPVSTFRSYDLMIRVSDVGPNANKVVVTPTLNGGGIELP